MLSLLWQNSHLIPLPLAATQEPGWPQWFHFTALQNSSSAEAHWRWYLILQVAEHLGQAFSFTQVSVGDEDKNGAEQLQQVAAMSPLQADQAVSLWSLLPKGEGRS